MNVRPLLFSTYLAVIRNSVGSTAYRNLYAEVNGEKQDITKNGDLSCAFFVSTVLSMFKLITESGHATVDGTVKDMLQSGWTEIKEPREGAVLVWSAVDFGGGDAHKHIGFYEEDGRAVSNNNQTGEVARHSWDFGGKRGVERILWNPRFDRKGTY